MKTNLIGSRGPATVSEFETVAMTIDDSGLSFLMHNLTNLYSQPARAILREYTANALDSHVRSGQTLPIKVTIPAPYSGSDGRLVIQDFGVGLSKDEIANVYARYGLSTKRDSNSQIGAFGLGCKSALAITERFDIVSVKDGIRNTVFIQKNPAGVGVFHFVSQEPTSDPNGVTISIPVNPKDFNFDLKNFFIGWKKGTVEVNGVLFDSESVYDESVHYEIKAGRNVTLGWVTKVSTSNSYNRTVSVLLGGILYEVKAATLEEKSTLEQKARFGELSRYNRNVYLNLPVGSVDLPPSREDLSYTDRTCAALHSAVDSFLLSLSASVQARVEDAPTRAAAGAIIVAERAASAPVEKFFYRGVEVPTVIRMDEASWRVIEKTSTSRKVSIQEKFPTYSPGVNFSNWINEAAPVVRVSSLSEAALVAKDFRDYLESFTHTSGKLYITTNKRFADAWVEDNVSKITVAEIQAIAKATRKVRYAAARESRAGSVTVKAPPSQIIFDMTAPNNHLRAKRVDQDQITGKVVYIHQSDSSSTLRNIFPSVVQLSRGSAPLYDRENTLALVRKHLPEYTLVFLQHNRSLERFMASFPDAVPLEDVLRPKAKELVAEFSKSSAFSYALDSFGANYQIINQIRRVQEFVTLLNGSLSPANISDIIDDGSREFFAQMVQDRSGLEMKAAFWGDFKPEVDPEVTVKAREIVTFLEKYPLLTSFGGLNLKHMSHIIAYVNMADKL